MLNDRKPRVTVLMPVYNGEAFLREAIDSILAQTFTDFEFLIINDGSTDRSVEIIESYDDARIRLMHNEKNLKLVSTLNMGLELARGEYIARMDCDDISLPERLSEQVRFMDERPEVGLCGTNARTININGELISPPWRKKTFVPIEWTLLWENPIVHPSVMLRASVLETNKIRYRDVLAEDGDLWSVLALKTKINNLPEVFLYYRLSDNSYFNLKRADHLAQAVKSSRDLASKITQKDVPAYHDELTMYLRLIGERPKLYNIHDLETWLVCLLEKSATIWGWSNKELRLATDDAQRRLMRYLLCFPELINLKSYLRILTLNSAYSIRVWHIEYFLRMLIVANYPLKPVIVLCLKSAKWVKSALNRALKGA